MKIYKKNKVLVIGSNGKMGSLHLRVLNKLKKKYNLKIILCDKTIPNGYTYENYIILDKPDYVIIATPTNSHKEILDCCIRQKIKNILVEKPIVDEGDYAKKYLDRKDVMVGHIERHNPIVKKIKQMVKRKNVDTILCIRSGLKNKHINYDLDIDLIIHDLDVCMYILGEVNTKLYSSLKNNSCNVFAYSPSRDTDVFLHADNLSPYKTRMIKVMGDGYIIEGDYIKQTIKLNNKPIKVDKEEPLKVELEHFLSRKYKKEELNHAIKSVVMLR